MTIKINGGVNGQGMQHEWERRNMKTVKILWIRLKDSITMDFNKAEVKGVDWFHLA
jgi:hypothetical protein